ARTRLDARAPDGAMLEVAAGIAGVHAQVLSSAELTLWARVEGLGPDHVRRALWEDRSLVKTWAMRGRRPRPPRPVGGPEPGQDLGHAGHPAPAARGRVPDVAGSPVHQAPVGGQVVAAGLRGQPARAGAAPRRRGRGPGRAPADPRGAGRPGRRAEHPR